MSDPQLAGPVLQSSSHVTVPDEHHLRVTAVRQQSRTRTLRKLRDQGYLLALISNASTAEVQAWPESPLQSLFDVSVFSCHVGMKKT